MSKKTDYVVAGADAGQQARPRRATLGVPVIDEAALRALLEGRPRCSKHETITKAVFPVAGLGTRFLPATKASPKEMLPVVDKPLIQYAVEEAAAAGITDMIFITGRNKRAIEDHFDKAYELETELARAGQDGAARPGAQTCCPTGINCIYIRQTEALGLGHAVLCAQPVVGDEPFAVLLADDLIDCDAAGDGADGAIFEHGRLRRARRRGGAARRRPAKLRHRRAHDECRATAQRIHSIVEKPKPGDAPSNLAVVGRYVLTPRIFDRLRTMHARRRRRDPAHRRHRGAAAAKRRCSPSACRDGATTAAASSATCRRRSSSALRHPEVGEAFARYLKSR